jgi:hypothetical protein
MSAASPGSTSCGGGTTRRKHCSTPSTYLELNGTDLRREPIEVRKATLAKKSQFWMGVRRVADRRHLRDVITIYIPAT